MKKIVFLLLFIFVTGCNLSLENFFDDSHKYKSVLNIVNDDLTGKISLFTIYGKYFNLEGSLNYLEEFEDVDLVLKSKSDELIYDLIYDVNETGIIFKTNEFINEGINLEQVELDNYVILLRVISSSKINYYNLINESEYQDLNYYTITKNKKNNLIKISFATYQETNFMKMEMQGSLSVVNACDIVIDPGHGGDDPGATNRNYQEKDFNLLYAKMLVSELENLGLKVKLTRENDVLPAFYGTNSRTGIPYECNAKLMLSIHLNSSLFYVGEGGVEIYMANGSSPTFPKMLADNIISNTTTRYSPNTSFKVMEGVYMRTYSQSDLDSVLKDAEKGNWPFYEKLDTNTTYYYFIRETGGIITNAITDGRNQEYPSNPYYNSNHGTESYLVELGYISSAKNLEKIINEKEGYIKGIVESVKYYINK